MRRILLAIALAGGAIAGLVGATATPSGAAHGLVDFGTTVESDPGVVAPPGALVRYVVTYSNSGAITWSGTASNATTGGGTLVAANGDTIGCTIPSANTVDPIITCDLTLAPGQTKILGVVVKTPANGDDLTNSSAVAAGLDLLGVIPDDNTTNDTATVETIVTAPAAGTSAYLRPGDSLQFRNHRMTVLSAAGAGGGVVASMSDPVLTPTTMCGDTVCDAGLHYDFEQGDPGEIYEGRVLIRVDFGATAPCRGGGNPTCRELYYRIQQTDVPKLVPDCATAAAPTGKVPCLQDWEKVGSNFVYNVRANSFDPDLISTVSGLATGGTKS